MYSEIVRIRLKGERNKAGYKQRQLSQLTGIGQSKLSKIESGNQTADPETIGTLAQFYGVSTDYLFGFSQK